MTEPLLMQLMDIFANVFMGLALMIGVICMGWRWSHFHEGRGGHAWGGLVAYERSCHLIPVRGGHRP
jgi:hypothetical protein